MSLFSRAYPVPPGELPLRILVGSAADGRPDIALAPRPLLLNIWPISPLNIRSQYLAHASAFFCVLAISWTSTFEGPKLDGRKWGIALPSCLTQFLEVFLMSLVFAVARNFLDSDRNISLWSRIHTLPCLSYRAFLKPENRSC